MRVDIVGGSISGLAAAQSLKQHNKDIDVVVHEKYKEIGYNHEGRRCGEAHSVESEWAKWKPIGDSVYTEILKVETQIGNRKYIVHRKPGTSCILNRQAFICQLAREAEKRGVQIETGDRISSVDDLDGDYLIDASGCPSTFKRELGIGRGIIGATYQQTLEDCNWFQADNVTIVFTGEFGYYWIFPRDPKKREVNLGIGVLGGFDLNLKKLLEEFKEKQQITGKINYVLGGPIPAGLQHPLMYKNILFIGDAGVGTFPLTGQGIYRALISGDVAGRCVASGQAQRYPHIIHQKFIKWHIIGVSMVYLNHVLRLVGPRAVFASLYYFIGMRGGIH